MFAGFGPEVQNLASAITLLLPGFLAVSLFELSNRDIARDRQPLQWVMWSLTYSVLLFAALHALYAWANWPRDPLDPEFYAGLIAIGLLAGYLSGRAAGSRHGRKLTRKLKLLLPAWIWVEVFTLEQWVVVHLTDGTILYGYPRRYTDDPRETVREIYLESPHILADFGDEKRFMPYPESEGVLIDSQRIALIQVLAPKEPSS